MWDQISEFIVPAVLLFLYLLASGKKKKTKHTQTVERRQPETVVSQRQALDPEPVRHSPPPVQRTQKVLHSEIEDRSLESKITSRKLVSSIHQRNSPLSAGMLEHIDADPSYALQSKKKSRAKHLLGKRSSLKKAFLMKEIFSPPQL